MLDEFIEAFKEPWIVIGLLAQLMFSARFLVQWVVSEEKGESTVPEVFWYFSLVGGLMLLAYAVQRREPIFVIGQAAGLIVYARNLMLISKTKREKNKGQPSA
jgi:lipid-A-disaccharide synthase-like uncharacterized protein